MASVSSPVLVGRDGELARLVEAVDRADGGRPQLVVVSGEAGIGKTRLLSELVAKARAAGSRILAGGCLDIGEGGVPYLPLAQALRGLVRATEPGELERLLGPTREDLATIAPELAGAAPAAPRSADAGSIGQARLFERVLELIGRLAESRPVVVVVEDAQWIDRATRDLITFLVRNATTERVAAFLTVRTDDLPRGHPNLVWLAELDRAPGGDRVVLEPLDRGAVGQQLTAIAGGPPDASLVERVWRRSQGNPFFAEELFAADSETGAGATPTLLEVLLARVRSLDPTTREVVSAIAVAGRPVDEQLLGAVVDAPVPAIRRALREAVDRHVVREDADGAVRVRHELLREVVERDLLVGERRALHERFASVLSAEPGLADPSPAGAAAELARHWAAAGRVREAYDAAIAAGRAAEAVHAHVDAHREYERAHELEAALRGDARPDLAARLELRRRAAESADLAGALDRAIELTREALDVAGELADPATTGVLHARLGYLLWATGDAAAGVAEHRRAVALVPPDPPSAARARVLGGLAGSLLGPGGYEESAALAEAAIACAQAAGAIPDEARARNVLGFDLVALGRPDAGLEQLRLSRDLAAQGGPPDMLVVAHYNLALNLVEAGRLEDALDEATAGREAARRAGLERRFGFDLAALAGDVLLRLGRWDAADAVTSAALRLDRADRGSAFLSAVRGRLEALRGDTASAERRFAVAEELGAGDDPDTDAYVACGRAELELARERPDAALAAVERAIERHGATHARFVRAPLLAVGLRAAADLAARAAAGRDHAAAGRAAVRASRLRNAIAEVRAATPGETTAATVELGLAEAARGSAADADASDRWRALADRLDGLRDRYGAAYARWRAAEAELRARGTRGDAERLLRDAYVVATELRARPLAAEVEALARRARLVVEQPVSAERPPEPAPDAPAADDGEAALRRSGLSAREIEVLRLVAAGRTNGQIGERLFITRKTAGVHVTHILDKLGVANRVEAAMVAARLGLEPTADDT